MLTGIFNLPSNQTKTFHYYGLSKESDVNYPQNAVIIYQEAEKPDLKWLLNQINQNQNTVILMPPSTTQLLNQSSKTLSQVKLFQNEKCLIIADNLEDYQTVLQASDRNRAFMNLNNLKYLSKRAILLTRDQTRVDHVNSYLLNTLSNLIITDAIDAQTPGAIDTYLKSCLLKVTSPIKAGMVGCFCSHHQLWIKFTTSEEVQPVQLIMEDDVIPHDSLVKDLKNIFSELPSTFDIVYFYSSQSASSPNISEHDLADSSANVSAQNEPKFKYLETVTQPESLCAYLISQKGATKLLKKFNKINNTLAEMVYQEVQNKDLEAYRSKKLIFTNIGLKETPKLCSNTQSSQVYPTKTKGSKSGKSKKGFFW
jgi:GR25 family glycosyltransferase involved in LPS biosynthesis